MRLGLGCGNVFLRGNESRRQKKYHGLPAVRGASMKQGKKNRREAITAKGVLEVITDISVIILTLIELARFILNK